MSTPPDPLDRLLNRWGPEVPPPGPPLGPDVWRRVAEGEGAPGLGRLARIAADFGRPAFAGAFIAACVLLGLFLAEVRLSRLQAQREAQLAKSYLYLIDPLLATATDRAAPAAPRT